MSIDTTLPESSAGKVGKYTKYQREKRGLSLNEFARKIGVTTSFLLRLERGNYQNVSYDVLQRIALGFDMSIEDFLYKCRLIESSSTLPPIEYYLREMYQFPISAINDIKLLITLLKEKYKDEIRDLKSKHKEYWEE